MFHLKFAIDGGDDLIAANNRAFSHGLLKVYRPLHA